MPAVDILDDTFVRADPPRVRARTGAMWASWLPGLRLEVSQDRGVKGVRWLVAGCDGNDLVGTAEVWLERVPGGTVVHLYVRLDPPAPHAGTPGATWATGSCRAALASRRARRERRRLPDRVRRTWKRELFRTKDRMEEEFPA